MYVLFHSFVYVLIVSYIFYLSIWLEKGFTHGKSFEMCIRLHSFDRPKVTIGFKSIVNDLFIGLLRSLRIRRTVDTCFQWT